MRLAFAVGVLMLLGGCAGRSPVPAVQEGTQCLPSNPDVNTYVYGWVASTGKTAVPDAAVLAKMLGHDHQVAATTDARGCYWIDLGVGLPHDVTVSKAGLRSETAKAVTLNSGEHRLLNFFLSPA